MNQLEVIFSELGISQYLDTFIDQGFDTWDTILDITESDLDALGVKLGHRRKLQRRIANYRGLAPVVSLVSPTRTSIEDSVSNNTALGGHAEIKDVAASAKRKYRRHPKPDENAPERPPSAYVLFSNKMREDLKGQNLSFTEIAKLVGENWQSLDRSEKDPYETQAQEAKERYNREISEYKKTDDYKRYSEYLQEFRKKQAMQEKDVSKRIKVDSGDSSTRGSSTSAASLGPSASNSNTESGSDSQPGSEPPPSRHHRLNSITSQPEPHISPVSSTGFQHRYSEDIPPVSRLQDDSTTGRPRGFSSSNILDTSDRNPRRHSILHDGQRPEGLLSLGFPAIANPDQRLTAGTAPLSAEPVVPSILSGMPQPSSSGSSAFWSRPPSLRTEQSSSASSSSISSYPPPRTPSDSSLPIHALLSSKPEGSGLGHPTNDSSIPSRLPSTTHHTVHTGDHAGALPSASAVTRPDILSTRILKQPPLAGYNLSSVSQLPPALPISIPPLSSLGEPPPRGIPKANRVTDNFDGVNALLQASDIVGREKQ